MMLYIIDKLDQLIRLTSVWLFLIIASIFIAIPCILFTPIDYLLVKYKVLPVYHQISVLLTVFTAQTILRLSGIALVLHDDARQYFGKECVLTCYNHSSSMDAFLIGASIPVKAMFISKSELFLIPFFSWLLVSFGGIAVQRHKREQAIQALGAAVASAGQGDCIAIAPEGTRSKNGQLIEFKKGPFHIWEQLNKAPIVPLLIFGSFDLFPPGNQMSHAGRVHVKLLPPIRTNEVKDRHEMSALVRRRMLEGLRDGPTDVGTDLSWSERLICWFNILCVFTTAYLLHSVIIVKLLQYIQRTLDITTMQSVYVLMMIPMVMTVATYAYSVYIAPFVRTMLSTL